LPWRGLTAFAFATAALALLHMLVAATALARPRLLRLPLRALGLGSFAYLLWIALQIAAPARYIAEIYGSLGQGVAAGLLAVLGLCALFTVPIGLWSFALSSKLGADRTSLAVGTALLLVFGAASLDAVVSGRAQALPLGEQPRAIERELAEVLPTWQALPLAEQHGSLFSAQPVRCPHRLDGSAAALIVHYTDRVGDVQGRCLQGPTATLGTRLSELLMHNAVRSAVAIDWLSTAQALRPQPGLLGSLADFLTVRPGLDGVCIGERCLGPWQLFALGVFAVSEPSQYLPQVRLGFGIRTVRALLGDRAPTADIDGLVRFSTQSVLIDDRGRLHAMTRLRPRDVRVNAQTLARAEQSAEAFLIDAQHADGTFRYELDGYRGTETKDNPSLPRHAGVTLVACELGSRSPQIRRVIRRSLDALAGYARNVGGLSTLTYTANERDGDLGSSALGLVALATCRELDGPRHDALIGRLSRFLLRTQDADGRFGPGMDMATGKLQHGPTPIFAGGQAIMALSLVERIAQRDVGARAQLPALRTLHDAVERGMNYVAERYWPSALRDFFFLKENWHCAAARVSLTHHRNDGYERFCIDFAESKGRVHLNQHDDVAPEFVGGFGFGNVIPPHIGSSAGLGEVMAAEVELLRARGQAVDEPLARVRRGLGFLLRQQAQPETCFACVVKARGWFSGFMVAPVGRIDHIQHTWSAIGHGARVLGLRTAAL
jgi:hypothetical protein